MFLSNQQLAANAFLILILAAAGCSWFRSEPAPSAPTAVAAPETGIPFETKEPETYQADLVSVAGGSETRSHYIRKDGRWRIDTFSGEKPSRSIIRTEKLIYLDHITKQYSEPPIAGPDPQPPFLADLMDSLLYEGNSAKFERMGSDGALERYSVSIGDANVPSTIIFDTTLKMVVRHEFEGGFAFEIRNFTLEVDDRIFTVPNGYRKIAWDVFKQL